MKTEFDFMGKTYMTLPYTPKVGEFGIYEGKVFCCVGRSGAGLKFAIQIEEVFGEEYFWLKGKDTKKVEMIIEVE